MNKKAFGVIGIIGVVALLALIGTGAVYYKSKISSTTSIPNGASTKTEAIRDITIADLATFFNTRLSCSVGKGKSASTKCFSDAFVALDAVGGTYDSPIIQFADFNGDGKQDALVTIYYSGSGAFRDFYALTLDGAVKVAYESKGIGVPRLNTDLGYNGVLDLRCPDANRDGKWDCQKYLKWDSTSKTFVEISNGPATCCQDEEADLNE